MVDFRGVAVHEIRRGVGSKTDMRERDGNRHEHTEPRFHFDSDRGTRLELPEGAGDSGRGGLEDHLDEDFFGMRARERER